MELLTSMYSGTFNAKRINTYYALCFLSNLCKLRSESCKKQKFIEMMYDGVCDKCKSVSCPNYGTCIDDGKDTKCVCQDSCADVIFF